MLRKLLPSHVLTMLLAAALSACAASAPRAPQITTPPLAAQVPHVVGSPNGDRMDPYYWLRDDSRSDPKVLAYLNAENAYAESRMAPTRPLEDKVFKEIVGRIQQDDASVPVFDNGYWYYTRFETGGEYPIYVRRAGIIDGILSGEEEILLNGNAMAQGQDFFQIGARDVSPDTRILAYAEDTVGRRQYVLRFKDLVSGQTLPDAIPNVDPGAAWANDSKTILYVEKNPETLLGERVKAHTLGTPVSADRLIYEEKDHSFYMGVGRSKSDRYLFIGVQSTLVSEWRYADANDPALKFRTVLPREANHEYQVENIGDDFIIRTNWKAPNFRIVRVPVARSANKSAWRDVIPHKPGTFIQDFDVFREALAVNLRSEGLLKIRIHPWRGGADTTIAADEPAYTADLEHLPELDSPVVRYQYTSLTTPATTYDYRLDGGGKTLLKREPVLGDFDPANYVTEYVHATAADGTEIPVSLVYRKGYAKNGTAPLLQYGYGSYGISIDPRFSSTRLSLLDRGFVFAIAHIRGGEELGRSWYENGKLLKKNNTFTDFTAVTEYLVKDGYADPKRVFALGGSAGGLLMGAIVNRRPELYRGVVAHVPFVDVVTTMLDESIPLTTNEFDEWGNPKQKKYYDYMLSYSPYDNVSARNYPAMLVTTGLWDSQVQYWEPAKWVAKLRIARSNDEPLYFITNMEAGHGGKSGRFQRYRETARDFAFMLDQAGINE